jgi:hypothetical protein
MVLFLSFLHELDVDFFMTSFFWGIDPKMVSKSICNSIWLFKILFCTVDCNICKVEFEYRYDDV